MCILFILVSESVFWKNMWLFHDICHLFLTDSMTFSGLKNKKHFYDFSRLHEFWHQRVLLSTTLTKHRPVFEGLCTKSRIGTNIFSPFLFCWNMVLYDVWLKYSSEKVVSFFTMSWFFNSFITIGQLISHWVSDGIPIPKEVPCFLFGKNKTLNK